MCDCFSAGDECAVADDPDRYHHVGRLRHLAEVAIAGLRESSRPLHPQLRDGRHEDDKQAGGKSLSNQKDGRHEDDQQAGGRSRSNQKDGRHEDDQQAGGRSRSNQKDGHHEDDQQAGVGRVAT